MKQNVVFVKVSRVNYQICFGSIVFCTNIGIQGTHCFQFLPKLFLNIGIIIIIIIVFFQCYFSRVPIALPKKRSEHEM